MTVSVIGIDIAKSVFQIHGKDASGKMVVRKRVSRARFLKEMGTFPPCLVGLEAGSGAHHWARELIALGHDARLMPPQYVRPYVKRNKHDAADQRGHRRGRGKARAHYVGDDYTGYGLACWLRSPP